MGFILQIKNYKSRSVKYNSFKVDYRNTELLNEQEIGFLTAFNLLKDRNIRNDIIEAVDKSHTGDNFLEFYKLLYENHILN